jgi:hypothetical protein
MRLEDDRHLAARPDQVRLDHLEDEAACGRGVEGIAATLQHRHGDGAGDPVGGGDGAERAADLRSRGEIDLHSPSSLRGQEV